MARNTTNNRRDVMEKAILKSTAAVGLSGFSMVCCWRCTAAPCSAHGDWLLLVRNSLCTHFALFVCPRLSSHLSPLDHHHQASHVLWLYCPLFDLRDIVCLLTTVSSGRIISLLNRYSRISFPLFLVRALQYPPNQCVSHIYGNSKEKGYDAMATFFSVILPYPLIYSSFFLGTKRIHPSSRFD